jgi:hypothetical protein
MNTFRGKDVDVAGDDGITVRMGVRVGRGGVLIFPVSFFFFLVRSQKDPHLKQLA